MPTFFLSSRPPSVIGGYLFAVAAMLVALVVTHRSSWSATALASSFTQAAVFTPITVIAPPRTNRRARCQKLSTGLPTESICFFVYSGASGKRAGETKIKTGGKWRRKTQLFPVGLFRCRGWGRPDPCAGDYIRRQADWSL